MSDAQDMGLTEILQWVLLCRTWYENLVCPVAYIPGNGVLCLRLQWFQLVLFRAFCGLTPIKMVTKSCLCNTVAFASSESFIQSTIGEPVGQSGHLAELSLNDFFSLFLLAMFLHVQNLDLKLLSL